jgi:hypothetical protein
VVCTWLIDLIVYSDGDSLDRGKGLGRESAHHGDRGNASAGAGAGAEYLVIVIVIVIAFSFFLLLVGSCCSFCTLALAYLFVA